MEKNKVDRTREGEREAENDSFLACPFPHILK